jgi:transcriptional regulator with XRE-family HTH domain
MSTTPGRFTGTRIRSVLEFQGRRQDWLADQVGISRATLNLAIKGERTLGADAAEKIATALGVPFVLLFESPIGDDLIPTGTVHEGIPA